MSWQGRTGFLKILVALLFTAITIGCVVHHLISVGAIDRSWLLPPATPNASPESLPDTTQIPPPAAFPIAVASPQAPPSASSPSPTLSPSRKSPQAMRQEKLGPPPEIDIDKLYAKTGALDDFARTTEAEALRVYDRLNSPTSPGYAEGRKAIRLFILVTIEDDLHGEAWAQIAAGYATDAYQKGNRDELVKTTFETFAFARHLIYTATDLDDYFRDIGKLQASPYPSILKLPVIITALAHLSLNSKNVIDPRDYYTRTLADLGLAAIEKISAEKVPPRILKTYTETYLLCTSTSYAQRQKYDSLVALALARTHAPESVTIALRGRFLIQLAWAVRGSGFANTVTPERHRKMMDFLQQAEDILEPAAAAYPLISWFPELLMSVELGQGRGRPRMEAYFRKATALSPYDTTPYACKMWYLQPRWYGTPQDVLDFCAECLAAGRQNDNVPLVILKGLDDLAENDRELDNHKDIRELRQHIYTDYLRRYPKSLRVRTSYLKYSAAIQDWDTVRKQLAILSGYWDLSVLSDSSYAEIIDQAAAAKP